jgi:hypothetical protein
MAISRIILGEWLPDQPAVVDSLKVAKNVVPLQVGYGSFPSSSDYSNAAGETLLRVFAGKFNATTQLFAASGSKLYKFDPATLDLEDVSKTGGYAATDWSIVQFGNSVLAANNADPIQYWTVGGTATEFDDAAANAPVAKYLTIVRDFVVAANLNGGTDANKVQWSDINDFSDWTSGATSQSDFQIVADGGSITGLTGGEFGLILLEQAIVRMSYIGSPFFFQFDVLTRNLGCMEGGSVTQYGNTTYFLSDNGFYSCDGTNITAIGDGKIDRYFFDNVNINLIETITSAVDPVKKLVVWNYPNISNGRSLLIYNYQVKKWSQADTTSDTIASIATSGFTLEDLDVYGTLDSLTTSLDDRLWAGGKFLFAGTTGEKITTFTGQALTAQITTSDIEQGYNSVVTLARPQIDNGSASIAVASRKNLDDTITFSNQVPATSEGRVSLRSFGRYHRFNIIPSGNWTNAVSIDVEVMPQGNR